MKKKFLIWGLLKRGLPNSFLPHLAPEAVVILDIAQHPLGFDNKGTVFQHEKGGHYGMPLQ
jgi:hypothetical protein